MRRARRRAAATQGSPVPDNRSLHPPRRAAHSGDMNITGNTIFIPGPTSATGLAARINFTPDQRMSLYATNCAGGPTPGHGAAFPEGGALARVHSSSPRRGPLGDLQPV